MKNREERQRHRHCHRKKICPFFPETPLFRNDTSFSFLFCFFVLFFFSFFNPFPLNLFLFCYKCLFYIYVSDFPAFFGYENQSFAIIKNKGLKTENLKATFLSKLIPKIKDFILDMNNKYRVLCLMDYNVERLYYF